MLSWGVNALQLQLSGPLVSFLPLPKQTDAFCQVESTQAPTFLSTTTNAQRDTMFLLCQLMIMLIHVGQILAFNVLFPLLASHHLMVHKMILFLMMSNVNFYHLFIFKYHLLRHLMMIKNIWMTLILHSYALYQLSHNFIQKQSSNVIW
eukprot:UN05429